MIVKRSFKRTKARFQNLCRAIKVEYWKTHDRFKKHGCSLRPVDIRKRAVKSATWATTLTVVVSLPIIVYYRGISDLSFYLGLTPVFVLAWLLFFVLVLVAHFLWTMSFIAGSKIGASEMFLNYIGSRWGKRIDEIAQTVMKENNINSIKTREVDADEDDEYHENEQSISNTSKGTVADSNDDNMNSVKNK